METTHRVLLGDSRDLDEIAADSVELVVTSPPYPMIELWDDAFGRLDPAIGASLDAGRGREAFDAMHELLAETWAELERVLVPGGIVCIVVGDATRRLDGRFRRYPNHARITEWFSAHEYDPLPSVLWRKPTNSVTKFMGSGMVPPNAYVTLEHEHILIFRNGERRSLPPDDDRRYRSAYFWEERNRWFSDTWSDVVGERQAIDQTDGPQRDRSAAFPLEIPYRLINMFSLYEDTVLDPFLGTGTTTLAALVAGRSSVGYELEGDLLSQLPEQLEVVGERSETLARDRLDRHRAFVEQRRSADDSPAYTATEYGVPVVTQQERRLQLYRVAGLDVSQDERGLRCEAHHKPVTPREPPPD